MAFKIQNKTLNSIDSRVKHLNKALQTTNKTTEKEINESNKRHEGVGTGVGSDVSWR